MRAEAITVLLLGHTAGSSASVKKIELALDALDRLSSDERSAVKLMEWTSLAAKCGTTSGFLAEMMTGGILSKKKGSADDGESTPSWAVATPLLGSSGAVVASEVSDEQTVRAIESMYSKEESHFLTVGHLLHVDLLARRMEHKLLTCSTPGSGSDCWRTALASLKESREMLYRRRSAPGEAMLMDIDAAKLYTGVKILELPYLCKPETILVGPLQTERSHFLESLAALWDAIGDGKSAVSVSDVFSLAFVMQATFLNCLNEGLSSYPYAAMLMAWRNLVEGKFRLEAAPVFDRKLKAVLRQADKIEELDKAVSFLQQLLSDEADQTDIPPEVYMENMRDRILAEPSLFLLWAATDGGSWRGQRIRLDLAEADLFQCLIIDRGQQYEFGSENIKAGGAVWCSEDPASRVLATQGAFNRPRRISAETNLQDILTDLRVNKGVSLHKLDQIH